MSGGAGSRLWPLSRQLYPKQLLPLAGERTMIQETVERVKGPQFAAPIVVCNQEHRFLIAEQLRSSGIEKPTIILEPVGRNTAPVAAVASLLLAEVDPWRARPSDARRPCRGRQSGVRKAVEIAAAAAREGAIATFGIQPGGPEDRLRLYPARRSDRRPRAPTASNASSKSRTAQRRRPISMPAIISGTAASSFSAPRPFSTSFSNSSRRSWCNARKRWRRAKAISISSAWMRRPSPRAPRNRSTMR